jgi:hypothetical protein
MTSKILTAIALTASLAASGCATMGTSEFAAPGQYRMGEPHITNEESPMIGNFGYVRGLGFGRVEDFKWHEVYETPRATAKGLKVLENLRNQDYSQ